jgi:hypothetical protein
MVMNRKDRKTSLQAKTKYCEHTFAHEPSTTVLGFRFLKISTTAFQGERGLQGRRH